MTSDLSNKLNLLKLNDRGRMSTNSTSRRSYPIHQNQHRSLHSKRAVTVDHNSHEEKIRIVVLGATKVGKTCLCQQFLQEKFVTDHKETVDEMYRAEFSLADRHIILEILDTAGINEFPVMRRLAIAHGDAFLIVYAVNSAHSFVIAQEMRQLVLEIKHDSIPNSIPLVIVGNKCDVDASLCEISRDYAETVVRDQWATNLIETTCYKRESVLYAFHSLLRLANISITLNSDTARRSLDSNLSLDKERSGSNKRQSCTQQ